MKMKTNIILLCKLTPSDGSANPFWVRVGATANDVWDKYLPCSGMAPNRQSANAVLVVATRVPTQPVDHFEARPYRWPVLDW